MRDKIAVSYDDVAIHIKPKALDKAALEAARHNYAQRLLDTTGPLSSQMFEDAVAHIEAHGWCQGDDVDEKTGQVCAVGAFALFTVDRIDGVGLRRWDATRVQIFHVRRHEIMDLMGIETPYGSAVGWNDAEGRTRDQVVDALTLAAKKLRDQGR
jgi:hypothetical protein